MLEVLALVFSIVGAGPASTEGAASAPARLRQITFDEALALAVKKNTQVRGALSDIERVEGLLGEARAGALPSINVNGTYTRLDAERRLQDRVIAGANQVSANVTVAVPILQPARWAQWSHATDNVKLAEMSADEVKRQVSVLTARAYFTVLALHRGVDVSARALAAAQEHASFARTRWNGGAGNRLDLVRAEQEYATSDVQLQQATAQLVRAQEALGVLVNDDAPVDIAGEPQLGAPRSLDEALAGAEERRRDIILAKTRAEAARRVERDSWTDYLPTLLGTFQPFYQNPPSLVNPLWGWQAQLIVNLPLYDGGLRYGARHERTGLRAGADAALEGALRQAKSDVRSAYENAARTAQAHQSAERAAALANEALKLASIAYRAGATTNLEVIDAERRARDAETQAAIAEDSARLARLDLLISGGMFP